MAESRIVNQISKISIRLGRAVPCSLTGIKRSGYRVPRMKARDIIFLLPVNCPPRRQTGRAVRCFICMYKPSNCETRFTLGRGARRRTEIYSSRVRPTRPRSTCDRSREISRKTVASYAPRSLVSPGALGIR